MIMATRIVGAEGKEGGRELLKMKLNPGKSKQDWFDSLVLFRDSIKGMAGKK